MECNRDEAIRAKSIAEGKLEQKDFFGAKKFALKAQALYPGLDGISQMLTTLDVYVSAENKISGEVDWYGVLAVNPSADDETIKKQYRRLALMLHPDKNNSVGADGAFKLISEAWSLLSDKGKRLAYNQRRGIRGFQQKVPTHTGGPSAHTGVGPSVRTGVGPSASSGARPSAQTGGRPSAQTGGPSAHTGGTAAHTGVPPASSRSNQFFKFASRATPAPKSQKKTAKVPSTPAPTPRTDTFWTICHLCKMQYEYLKMYRNSTLLCPTCSKPFPAVETAPPRFSNSSKPGPWQPKQSSTDNLTSQNANDPGRNVSAAQKSGAGQAGPNANFQQVPLTGKTSTDSTDPSIASNAANYVVVTHTKVKRSRAPAGSEGFTKKRKLDDSSSSNGMNPNMAQGNIGSGTTTESSSRVYGFGTTTESSSRVYSFSGTCHQPNSTRELTPMETRKLLMVKAQKEILKMLSESRSETTAKVAHKEKDKTKESNKERYKNNNSKKHDSNWNSVFSATKIAEQEEKHQARRSVDNSSKDYPEAVIMNVPDPDFHDFDEDRSERSFADNEVWAAYDDDDGMPRFYALISKVISRKPFKLRISWLNSKTNSEFSTVDWVGSGFYKTCGEFRVGKYETCKSINAFSQKVNWSKGPRGSILILPQKGDVWALYRNWSSDWNEHTLDEVIHKYDMVMVLDDYSEEQGVSVAPLIKVIGFRTIFHPNLNSEVIKRIPKEEIFRFSHRVPSHLLTSLEAQNAPKGCLELDPAATPLELLRKITDTNEDPVVPNRGNVELGVMHSVPVTNLEEIVDGTYEPQAVNIQEQSQDKLGRGKETCQGDVTECIQATISTQV